MLYNTQPHSRPLHLFLTVKPYRFQTHHQILLFGKGFIATTAYQIS